MKRSNGPSLRAWRAVGLRVFVAVAVGIVPIVALGLGSARRVEAYVVLVPRPWEGPTITYAQTSGDRWVVEKAVQNWNGKRLPVRFVATSPAAAQVKVRYAGRGCRGWFVAPAQVVLTRRARGCTRRHMAILATHELGHVIGLRHENRGCAIMNSVLHAPPAKGSRRVPCGTSRITRDDVAGVRRLYSAP